MASRKYEKLKKQKDAAISDIKNETVKLEVVSEEAKRYRKYPGMYLLSWVI